MEDHTYYISNIPRLDPGSKEFWIGWLLSRKYEGKQGYEALQTTDGTFCCLGVYCEEVGVPKVQAEARVWYGDPGLFAKGYIPENYRIPWAGMERHPVFGTAYNGSQVVFEIREQGKGVWDEDVYPRPQTIAQLNDSQQFTFTQIADIINYFL